jgi:predicted phosphate transport protein (TIGR00153 family)
MVFPVETEERVKRRALTICQDHLRKVVEIARKVPRLVDDFVKGNKTSVRQLHMEIRKAEEEVDVARRGVAQELAEIGAILISREDFLRFTSLTSEIADFCEGIAFRLLEIAERDYKVPSDVKKDLCKLSDAMLEAVLKLRETAMTLNYGADKVSEKAREVEVAERTVDDLYRQLEVKILSGQIAIPALLLLRDVLQLIEDVADKAEDAADATRILAFAI